MIRFIFNKYNTDQVKKFMQSQDGVVSVDFVVLSAGAVAIAIFAGFAVDVGITDAVVSIDNTLQDPVALHETD